MHYLYIALGSGRARILRHRYQQSSVVRVAGQFVYLLNSPVCSLHGLMTPELISLFGEPGLVKERKKRPVGSRRSKEYRTISSDDGPAVEEEMWWRAVAS